MPSVNRPRLQASIDEMATNGATPAGGVNRLALTDEDKAARDLLRTWMTDAGLEVRVDDIGNMIGRRAGTSNQPPIIIGSHLDTVPMGGKYDGTLGVLSGLEVIRALNDANITTTLPIEIINWTGEEGSRFIPSLLGSGAALGVRTIEHSWSRQDRDGKLVKDELARIGYLGKADNRPTEATAYLELHIEQGPVLEAENLPVGAVLGVIGQMWHTISVDGKAGHAGSTPMADRHDALIAASEVILGLRQLAMEAENYAVATVGHIRVQPDAMNVIPSRAEFTADIRAASKSDLQMIDQGLHRLAEESAAKHGVTFDISEHAGDESHPFNPHITSIISNAITNLGIPLHQQWSGPGHDAQVAASVWPSGMIFVRTKDGLSHAEAEYASPDDIGIATQVLLDSTIALAH